MRTAENLPLISIIVIAYNSEKTIIETLNSIRDLDYPDKELIICDDASTDQTVQLVKNWITKNQMLFKIHLLESKVNNGIPANCNLGLKIAKGEWIKLIAADDLLCSSSIKQIIERCGTDDNIVSGKIITFEERNGQKIILQNPYPNKNYLNFFKKSPQLQYRILLRRSFNFAPGVLLRKSFLDNIGYFDEEYTYLEDLPMWLKITKSGYPIRYFDIETVLYRRNANSMVCQKSAFYNIKFMECLFKFHRERVYPEIKWYDFIYWESEFIYKLTFNLISKLFHNKRTKLSVLIYSILNKLMMVKWQPY